MKKFLKTSLAILLAVGVVTGASFAISSGVDAETTPITLPTIHICKHTYKEVIDTKYLKETRNFEHGDIYYKSCSKCGVKSTETFEDGSAYIYGDADDDGYVDDTDMLLLIQYVANYDWDSETSSVEVEPGADANGDGAVDDTDMLLLIQYVANFDWDTETSTIILGPEA